VGSDEDLLAIGREIRRHRVAKKLSQEKLAELAGLHRNYIGYLERGERNPRVDKLFNIAQALDMEFGKLFGDVSEPRKRKRA
jgi:transcriptional regulator with XRE-family HTH domain